MRKNWPDTAKQPTCLQRAEHTPVASPVAPVELRWWTLIAIKNRFPQLEQFYFTLSFYLPTLFLVKTKNNNVH